MQTAPHCATDDTKMVIVTRINWAGIVEGSAWYCPYCGGGWEID